MTNEELHWLAGLAEGEGCFTTNHGGKELRFQIKMSDLDIIEKVQRIIGTGSIYKIAKVRDNKQCWTYDLSGTAKATYLMMKLYPLMGLRRQLRIRELLPEHAFACAGSHTETP